MTRSVEVDRFGEAVHKLTREHIVSTPFQVKQHYERHDALIVQLRKAAVSGVVNDGGAGKKDPRERIPLDPDALTKYENLTGQIGSFFLEYVGSRPPRALKAEQVLPRAFRAFDNAWRAGKVTDDYRAHVSKRWERWVTTIEDKLAGLTHIEITAPCPLCAFEWIIDKDGDQVRALVATYKDDERGGLSKAYASCRLCGEQWVGDGALRKLRILLDEIEEARLKREAEDSDSRRVVS